MFCLFLNFAGNRQAQIIHKEPDFWIRGSSIHAIIEEKLQKFDKTYDILYKKYVKESKNNYIKS